MQPDPDDAIRREVVAHCGIRGRVVDYGCGEGHWLPALSERCETITAIDCDSGMAALAAARGIPNVSVVVDDTLDSVETASVDAITCITTLQILDSGAEWHVFFAGAYRVLKPGGVLLMHVPTYRLARDHFLELEGIRSIKVNGWRWGIDRQLGWLLLWWRAIMRRSIEATPKYYCVRPSAVEAVIRARKFEILEGPEILGRHTRVSELSGLRSPNKDRPRYSWWLVRKVA